MKKFLAIVTLAAATFSAACDKIPAKPVAEDAAIRTALQSYLSQRGNLNMSGMDMDIQVARNDGKTADVNVTFRAKQGGGSMQMAYQLEKQGNAWVVKGSKTPGGSSHPDVGGGAAAPGGDLPAAHPPVTPQQTPPPPEKRP